MSTQDTHQQRGFVLFSCGGDHMMTTTRLPCPGCCRKFAQNHLYRRFAVGDRMLSAVGARLLLLFCCFFLLKEGSWKASKSHCERTDASVHVDPVYVPLFLLRKMRWRTLCHGQMKNDLFLLKAPSKKLSVKRPFKFERIIV